MLLLPAAKVSPVLDATRTLGLCRDCLAILFMGYIKLLASHHTTEQSPTTGPNTFHGQSMNSKSFWNVEVPDRLVSQHTPIHNYFRSSGALLHGH